MEILNEKYFRKRMININYLTQKILEEMGCKKYKLIVLKISPQTLEIYKNWWNSYKELKNNFILKFNIKFNLLNNYSHYQIL